MSGIPASDMVVGDFSGDGLSGIPASDFGRFFLLQSDVLYPEEELRWLSPVSTRGLM